MKGQERRPLLQVLARHAARVRSRRTLLLGLLRALGLTLLVAVAAAPFAAVWGIGHARVDDYLGPHRVVFASNFDGELEIDLGPLGNAFLPSPAAPIGLTITIGGLAGSSGSLDGLLSDQTLGAYTSLYADPAAAVQGVLERLQRRALGDAAVAEAVLLIAAAAFHLRARLLSPWIARRLTRPRAAATYLALVGLVIGSILAPVPAPAGRTNVSFTFHDRTVTIAVDSPVLADLLDRGVKGVTLLSARQQKAVRDYIDDAYASLSTKFAELPAPGPGETMLMGFSDLHCNQAMTQLVTRLVRATHPAVMLGSGDDTVNGTAVERGCIKAESAIPGGIPFVVATGNHDSAVTETQMKSDGISVLDGAVITVDLPAGDGGAKLAVLGDDDPEHNIPFSVERVHERPETEEQMAARLIEVARGRRTDVLLVHQPAAANVLMTGPDVPARLVLWGHFHSQLGPTVSYHADGSWTVGMQEGTAGGVREPTITSFSTPFSPPLISADVYFYFRDNATGLITAVQPVHFRPDATVVIDRRIPTGDLLTLPPETRAKLAGETAPPSPSAGPSSAPPGATVSPTSSP